MRIINPEANPHAAAIEAVRTRLSAILASKAADRLVDFDDVRNALPAPIAAQAHDGIIHAAATALGLKVEL